MPARIIDGVNLAQKFRDQIAQRVKAINAQGRPVRLDAVLVGDTDNAARVYANNQAKTCEALGIEYKLHILHEGASYDDIAGRVLLLNTEDKVTAIMVHLPMPEGVDPYRIQRLIAPEKDVEGVNPANIGNVVYGRSSLAPCTGLAVVKMVESIMPEFDPAWKSPAPMLRGKVCVVVGAGDTVGKPIAVLLMRQEGTIISCNKFTPGLKDLAKRADVLVAAAGVPNLITADMVKPGAAVIDVGVNRVKDATGKNKTVGDVAFDEVSKVAGWLSPVPGGVGPVTVSMLLLNVVEAAER
jgi:methylenetetrahydrofolate dehydrogenase (NADP+)/methenyltetrahydrofolate cyclohydrolase